MFAMPSRRRRQLVEDASLLASACRPATIRNRRQHLAPRAHADPVCHPRQRSDFADAAPVIGRPCELAAERVHSFKKAEMAETAEDLLIGTSWLPKPLRTPGQTFAAGIEPVSLADDDADGQSAKDDGEPAMHESASGDEASDPSAAAAAVAAE